MTASAPVTPSAGCAGMVEAVESRIAPDEPLAVVATGPAGAARRSVLAALLDVPPTTLPTATW